MTGLGLFGITDFAGFVDFFARKANVCGSRSIVLVWNISDRPNFPTLLCRIVFVCEPTFRAGFDFQRTMAL